MTALPPTSLASAFSNYPSLLSRSPIGQPGPQASALTGLMTAPPSPSPMGLQQLMALLAPHITPYGGPRGGALPARPIRWHRRPGPIPSARARARAPASSSSCSSS
jgi:hypothetical protein